MDFKISLDQLFELLPDSQVEGILQNKDLNGIASLERAKQGDISFLGNAKYSGSFLPFKNMIIGVVFRIVVFPARGGATIRLR